MNKRIKRPDHKNAQTLLNAANSDMEFTLSLPITESAGPTIIRNVYECFRMLGDAILLIKGKESEDHILPIKEVIALDLNTTRSLRLLDNLRRTRHGINYYGYKPKIEYIKDASSFANACFNPVLDAINEMMI